MNYTVDQFSTQFNVEKPVAYGFLRLLADKGMVSTSKADKPAGTRGKPATIYTFSPETAEKFSAFVDGFGNAPAVEAAPEVASVEVSAEQPAA